MKEAKITRPRTSRGRKPGAAKRPFDIEAAIPLLREVVRPFPKAALFELAAEGLDTVLQQLVACVISIRTLDETTLPVARHLFARAPTPQKLAALSAGEIDQLIRDCTFHEAKAQTLRAIAQRTVEEFAGELPCDGEVLQSFHRVGPKCSNLVLGIACGEASIGVDIHVHRVTNRWGFVQTTSPEKTMAALQEKLPRAYWVEINALLVPFGKHICTGNLPHCSECPLLPMCRQVGVQAHR
jgi:endonuclease-3